MPTRTATTRYGRLEILRNRMKQEFGPPSNVLLSSNTLCNDDTSSQRSDCTSMASWGRNLLMERNTGDCLFAVVRLADSLSTRAMPAMVFKSNEKNKNDTSQNSSQAHCFSFSEGKVEDDDLNCTNLEIKINSESVTGLAQKEISNYEKEEVALATSSHFYRSLDQKKQVNMKVIYVLYLNIF